MACTKKRSVRRKAVEPETKHAAARRRRRAPDASAAQSPPDDFPIVVVGGSAGALRAYKKFLASMPEDCGIAFVLVPHLDPTHESLMVELLAKQTPMPVREARQRTRIEPNHVYVIPPNKYLAIKRRKLVLSKPPATRGTRTAIDGALISAAEDLGDAAIGIVMSGTGSHGLLGVKEIKLVGGMVMAQDPATAEFDQMPRSAIATGLVDFVLAPEHMPAALLSYVENIAESRGGDAMSSEDDIAGLASLFAVMQANAKHDFRHYRKNMILRRVQRRMALVHITNLHEYIEHLRQNSDEAQALRKDLLIGVTAFFRDPKAFDALAERVIPRLVEQSTAESPVRVWVPGCATGEEAYSIGMLLLEEFKRANKAANAQIFATDVDEDSLKVARQSIYADNIEAMLSSQRLQRFFVKLDMHNYQVGKPLRDTIVFAPQNLISDAPFSNLDLISCRNVLIYFEPSVQARILSLLHFALNEDGYLLLGPSETTDRAPTMFAPVSKRWRLFRKVGPSRRDLVSIPAVAARNRRPQGVGAAHGREANGGLVNIMHRILAKEFAPASALIDRADEILAVQGPLVNYLEFPAGDMTKNLQTMARAGLRAKIRAACRQAIREGRTVRMADARVRRNGKYVPCTITVRPITEPREADGLLLVAFEDRPVEPADVREVEQAGAESSLARQLEDDLRITREDLQSTIDELESSNEELKASNEEVMSMNEELQSANEELETSKEELQSLYEELATVNNQLQDKVEDLDRANTDLTNLMAATEIATIFLDTDLRIKRYTPPTDKLFSLVAADIDRPFRDMAPRFEDEDLLNDAERVLATFHTAEKEVLTDDGHWYLRRILPYRTGADRVAGVVITFFDITHRMQAETRARRLAKVLLDSNDAIVICDLEGRITAWNAGAERMYGYTGPQALAMNIHDLVPDDLRRGVIEIYDRAARGETPRSFEGKRIARDGRLLDVWLTPTPLKDESGKIVAVATTERDITARLRAEAENRALNATLEQRVAEGTAALEANERRIRSLVDSMIDAIVTIDRKGTIETFNAAAETIFGYNALEAIGQNVTLLMGSPYREEHDDHLRRYLSTGVPHIIGATRELTARRKDGSEFPIQLTVSEIEHLGLFTGIVRDITEQRALQGEIVRIATREQQRIGEELHDSAQQALTGLGLLAQNLSETLAAREKNRESELAAKLAAGIADTNRQLRALAKGLVPVPVDAQGLMAALTELAKTTTDQHGIACRFECPRAVEVADDFVATHLYRIAKEAVTNAVRHAEADTITIRLEAGERGLDLAVSDDGIGIGSRASPSAGLGLRIMEHRCAILGGSLMVRPHDSGGTTVSCALPGAWGP